MPKSLQKNISVRCFFRDSYRPWHLNRRKKRTKRLDGLFQKWAISTWCAPAYYQSVFFGTKTRLRAGFKVLTGFSISLTFWFLFFLFYSFSLTFGYLNDYSVWVFWFNLMMVSHAKAKIFKIFEMGRVIRILDYLKKLPNSA